jgi:hypothetical protein
MGHGMDPFQEVGASRGNAQNNWTLAFKPSWVSPCLMVLGTLDLEDLKVPYLSNSNVHRCEKQIMGGYLDAYPRDPTQTKTLF